MNAEFTPNKNTLKHVDTFRHWCQKVLPLVYDDSLSYYELLCKVTNYLNEVIENSKLLGEDVSNLYGAYVELQEYTNEYFGELDVQEEINVKLDNMAKSGDLDAMIGATFSGIMNDLAVLDSRVTNLASLESGSTTGDAELLDSRVDYKGNTWNSLGEHLRGVGSQLSSEIEMLNKKNNTIPLSAYSQGSFDGGGNPFQSNNFVKLEIEDVKGKQIYIKTLNGYTAKVYNVVDGVFNNIIFEYNPSGLHLCSGDKVKVKISNTNGLAITPLDAFNNVQIVVLNNDRVVPKTVSLSYTLKLGGMYPDGNYTSVSSSAYSVQLHLAGNNKLVVGEKYRIKVSNGYDIYLKHGGQRRCIYDTQMIDFVADNENLRVCLVRRDSEAKESIDDFTDLTVEISQVLYKNTLGYDYVVASSNTDEHLKEIADLVCDGINDEVYINCAINGNITSKNTCKVLLLNGTYNVGKFHNIRPSYSSSYYEADSSLWGAICVMDKFGSNSSYERYDVRLEGESGVQFLHDTKTTISENVGSAVLNVSKNVMDTMNDSDEYCVIMGVRDTTIKQYMGAYGMNKTLMVNNININFYNSSKKVVGIDGVGLHGLAVERVSVYATEGADYNGSILMLDSTPFAEGACGIRGDKGNDNGTGKTYFKSCLVIGLTEGIALTGEHIVLENCLEKFCKIGLTVGNYDVSKELQHPIVCIGNSIEQCERMMLLNRFGATSESEVDKAVQTIVYIGGSTETSAHYTTGTVSMKPIKEVVKGAYRGRIESDYRGANISIFENDNSGKNMCAVVY